MVCSGFSFLLLQPLPDNDKRRQQHFTERHHNQMDRDISHFKFHFRFTLLAFRYRESFLVLRVIDNSDSPAILSVRTI